jgi:acetolactate synthase-1/2/3 large subunit
MGGNTIIVPRKVKASDLFVESLENEGVRYIFGVPGEENLDFMESLRKSRITFIVTRHEQAAGFMAATWGRLTGQTGVCLSTVGPGATNFVTAAAFAQLGGTPMLMITGQKPIKKSKQGEFQIVDTIEMMNPVTKFNKQIVSGDSIPALVREAFRSAEEEKPGAVHLELPEDIASEMASTRPLTVRAARRPAADPKAVAQAVDMIEGARHPLILIGAGANRKMISNMLNRFVEKTGIPFLNTQMGKGVIDEMHPLFLGTAALSGDDFIHCAVDRADLIINVGHDIVEKPPFIMEQNGTRVIHVNFFSAKVNEIYFPQLEVVGDVANAIWQINEKIRKQGHWDLRYFLKIKDLLEEHIDTKSADTAFPPLPQRIVADVREVMPDDGFVVLDNGMYKIWFARNYKACQPNTLILDNALAAMGGGLPSAMATRLVHPGKKILAIVGDGGFMMNSQELETAVRMKLNLVILLLNDNGYGMIHWKQQGMGFEDFGLSFGNPDFVRYAESYGARGYRIEKTADLQALLSRCLNEEGVHLIEAPIDYTENDRVFNRELKEMVCPT